MKRSIKATVLGVAIFGVTVAAAAGFDLTSDNLGSGDAVVASCQDADINVTYTATFDDGLGADPAGRYKVDTVTLEDVEAQCVGQAVQITLSDAAGESLYETTDETIGSVGDNEYSVTDDVLTEAVEGVHVVITGEAA